MLTLDKIIRRVKFFKNSAGNCPVTNFLDSLSAKQAQKVAWVMRLIERLEIIPELYLKKLNATDGIWEIRIQSGSNIFRVLGFFEINNFIVTNSFCKKSQKTPPNEINLAIKRKQEYLNRRG